MRVVGYLEIRYRDRVEFRHLEIRYLETVRHVGV